MAKKMGYQTPIYYGTKGSQASTLLENAVDVTYGVSPTTGSTTSRGDGTTVPKATGESTLLTPSLTFNMIVDDTDSALTALIAAARTGVAVAIRTLTFDSDCILAVEDGRPLEGEATVSFTLQSVSASDRTPIF